LDRYLVTGGAGFIGSHLCEALVARGDRVRVLDDLSSGRRANLEPLGLGPVGSDAPVELLEADVADPDVLGIALAGVAGVFHEAAQVSVPQSVERPVRSLDVNALATLRLLEAARGAGVERFVFAGSSAAYGDSETLPKHEGLPVDPLSPYAIGKVAGEQCLRVYGRLHGMRTVTLRYFNVFGPWQDPNSQYAAVVPKFITAFLAEQAPVIHGDGLQSRDFTYVQNVVEANLAAAAAPASAGGRAYNIALGGRVTVKELCERIRHLVGAEVRPRHDESRAGDVRHSQADNAVLRSLFPEVRATPLAEGLAQTFAWFATLSGDGR
jgi:nucleoside-diphosphate-sugar epimerase